MDELTENESTPLEIELWASLYSENKKRILIKKFMMMTFFEIVYDIKRREIFVNKKDYTIYSLIAYDIVRKYI